MENVLFEIGMIAEQIRKINSLAVQEDDKDSIQAALYVGNECLSKIISLANGEGGASA